MDAAIPTGVVGVRPLGLLRILTILTIPSRAPLDLFC
jgi:hypothetical protein